MDTPLSATLIKPRLRLFRRSPSPRSAEATPQPGPSSVARPLFPAVHDDEDEFPTPRVNPKPIASLNPDPTPNLFPISATPTETPAARLRALLARESRSPTSATPPPPAPPSEIDSETQSARLGSSTSSVARGSLKDIFSRALREPGDTPEKGRPRRNSFDGSSMEITPVVDKNRGHRRPPRRSLSDEETENPKFSRRSRSPFRLSTVVAFDNLRSRLTSSQSQLVHQNPQDALYDRPSLASITSDHPHPSTPPGTSITPHPSFQMSSQLAFQSNLLEQDSEMQRVMGDVINSESEASTPPPKISQSTSIPSDFRPSSSLSGSKSGSRLDDKRTVNSSTSSSNDKAYPSQEEERIHQREREWNRPRLPSGSSTPERHRKHSQEFHRRLSQDFHPNSHAKSFSHESVVSQNAGPVHRPLERRGSLASLRSFDDDHSSQPSSIGSQTDYRDRISELERERNHEREREWNKRHLPSRPSSSLSVGSNRSLSQSHPNPSRSPSAIPYLTPTRASLQRKTSRTSLRSDSPASLASSRESLKERDEEERKEETYERERNWNSPRPHWSGSKSPSDSYHRVRNNSLRSTPSLTHLRKTNEYEDTPQMLQGTASKVNLTPPASPGVPHKSGNPGSNQSSPSKGPSPSKTPGASSRFGWNFSRSPLPPLELDDSTGRRKSMSSPISGSQPKSTVSGTTASSHLPVRSRMKSFSSVGHAPSDMSFTHVIGDEPGCSSEQTEIVDPRNHDEHLGAGASWSQEDVVLVSDEESISDPPPQSTTPRGNPPNPVPEEVDTDTETEILASPVQGFPQSSSLPAPNERSVWKTNNPPHSQTRNTSEEPLASVTPPGTPPSIDAGPQLHTSVASPSFPLATPPRHKSFASSILDFQTPSPPHDLSDLPAPPLSDDDALGATPMDQHVPSFTLTKTPKPPGAWATTPLPSKSGHRPTSAAPLFPLESTPPASTSTPLPRANTYPHTQVKPVPDDHGEDALVTPIGALSRAKSLPLRTPAPPGAWMATPGQTMIIGQGADQSQFGSLGRRKSLLKVRFDVTESETSATEGRSMSPLSAIRLTNPELPSPKSTMDRSTEAIQTEELRPQPHRPTTPERPATPMSRENGPSPRSLRKSPAVRMMDAYGRERVEEGGGTPLVDLTDAVEPTAPPSISSHSLVRIVDAMGREVDDTAEMADAPDDSANKSFEADVSVVSDDNSIGHAEALVRMRKTLKDLAESLNDADRSEDLELNSSHLEQLEEVSQAARLARNQLAHNLQVETSKQQGLERDGKITARTRGLVPTSSKKPWSTAIVYCGVVIQLLLVLAMWRYAHVEAHRLFYTTYYDPLYPELTPAQGDSYISGTLSTSRSWTLHDSYETIRREGWLSVRREMLRGMRHVGEQAWERWGEHARYEKPT